MIHFNVLWCAWASGAAAAVISCHSHNTEYQCTAATFAVSASMFQVERMMTSLLAVMITFGTQAVGKLAKRLSDWQPLSVSCCYREGKCQDVWCLAAWHCVSDSCQRCPRAGPVPRGKCKGKYGFWGEQLHQGFGKDGWWAQSHACHRNIYHKCMNSQPNGRNETLLQYHASTWCKHVNTYASPFK